MEKTVIPNICEPPCVNGVCYNEKCLCEQDFSGQDCSVALKQSKNKKDFIFVILVLGATVILAILFTISMFYLFSFMCSKGKEYRDFNLHEEWQKEDN